MKLKNQITTLALSALIVGCSQSDHSSTTSSSSTNAPVASQDLKEDYKQALKDTKDYAVQGKDDFMVATSKKLQELDAKIDQLAAKSGEYKDDAKVQADKALAALREERDALRVKYGELKQASQDAWQSAKDSFNSAWDKVQKALDDAKAKFQ